MKYNFIDSLVLCVILLLHSCNSYRNHGYIEENRDAVAFVTGGYYFKNDTLKMYFDSICVIDTVITSTSLGTCMPGFYILKDRNNYKITHCLHIFSDKAIQIRKNRINIYTSLNGYNQTFTFNFKKGKYLLLSKYFGDTIYFQQSKKEFLFEW